MERTRRQALAEGLLIDLTEHSDFGEMAKRYSNLPVAVTKLAWEAISRLAQSLEDDARDTDATTTMPPRIGLVEQMLQQCSSHLKSRSQRDPVLHFSCEHDGFTPLTFICHVTHDRDDGKRRVATMRSNVSDELNVYHYIMPDEYDGTPMRWPCSSSSCGKYIWTNPLPKLTGKRNLGEHVTTLVCKSCRDKRNRDE